MKYSILLILLVTTLFACKEISLSEWDKNSSKAELELYQFQNFNISEIQQSDSISEMWNKMVYEKGGCLGGQQYVKGSTPNRKIKSLVFSESDWRKFSANNKTLLTEFLISQLSDTTQTKVHTCPFFNASNGEMAVYSLQQIHLKNWYDFNEFIGFKDRDYTSGTDQSQVWLQKILDNEIERKKLAELFRNELKK